MKLPKNAAGDIVLHGNYPFLNLFEGNIVQSIVVDKSHGMNGPFNTFFRNRAELYGIFMVGKSNAQNFINNEITNRKFLYGLFILKGKGHFVQGNLIKHRQTTHSIVSNWSLYYKNIPDFLKQYENMATSIPAKDRIFNEK